jgi:hypothetical protein
VTIVRRPVEWRRRWPGLAVSQAHRIEQAWFVRRGVDLHLRRVPRVIDIRRVEWQDRAHSSCGASVRESRSGRHDRRPEVFPRYESPRLLRDSGWARPAGDSHASSDWRHLVADSAAVSVMAFDRPDCRRCRRLRSRSRACCTDCSKRIRRGGDTIEEASQPLEAENPLIRG